MTTCGWQNDLHRDTVHVDTWQQTSSYLLFSTVCSDCCLLSPMCTVSTVGVVNMSVQLTTFLSSSSSISGVMQDFVSSSGCCAIFSFADFSVTGFARGCLSEILLRAV